MRPSPSPSPVQRLLAAIATLLLLWASPAPALGRQVSTMDANKAEQVQALDALGRPVAYTYDGVGRLREVRRAQESCAPFIGSSRCKLEGVAPWFSYDYAGSEPVAMYEGAR